MSRIFGYLTVIIIFNFLAIYTSLAQDTSLEESDIFSDIRKKAQTGPLLIENIWDQAKLSINEGHAFIMPQEGKEFMDIFGNATTPETFVGIITDNDFKFEWFAWIRYIKSGYVKPTEINKAELFHAMKESIQHSNIDAEKNGLSILEILSWIDEPVYNPNIHEISWSILARETIDGKALFNTNATIIKLGKDGYFEVVLVADKNAKDLSFLKSITDNLIFLEGKKYEDYKVGDPVSTATFDSVILGGGFKEDPLESSIQTLSQNYKFIILTILALIIFLSNKIKKLFTK